MKRRIQIIALGCAIIYAPNTAADTSLFNVGLNKDDAKKITEEFFNRFDESAKKFFEIPDDGLSNNESAAQKFIKKLHDMGNTKMAELENFGHSFLKKCAFMGLTGLSGCFAIHALHQTVLAYIKYRNTTDNDQKEHADLVKYYASIACITGGLCIYSAFSLINLFAETTQTLPVPSVQ
jgi:hypothetical protein